MTSDAVEVLWESHRGLLRIVEDRVFGRRCERRGRLEEAWYPLSLEEGYTSLMQELVASAALPGPESASGG